MMDRRQRKTRQAIFGAFSELLAKKNISKISVGEIIEKADVGRATFYSHFETKDFLLKEFCGELFCHVFDVFEGYGTKHKHIFDCDTNDSVFLHLFRHLQKNDNNISALMTGDNNELFMEYFKKDLKNLIKSQKDVAGLFKERCLPEDYWINHVSSVFVETAKWWFDGGMKESCVQITQYFLSAAGIDSDSKLDNESI